MSYTSNKLELTIPVNINFDLIVKTSYLYGDNGKIDDIEMKNKFLEEINENRDKLTEYFIYFLQNNIKSIDANDLWVYCVDDFEIEITPNL